MQLRYAGRLSVHIYRLLNRYWGTWYVLWSVKVIPKNANSFECFSLIDWALVWRTSAKISYPPMVKVWMNKFIDQEGMRTYANAPYPCQLFLAKRTGNAIRKHSILSNRRRFRIWNNSHWFNTTAEPYMQAFRFHSNNVTPSKAPIPNLTPTPLSRSHPGAPAAKNVKTADVSGIPIPFKAFTMEVCSHVFNFESETVLFRARNMMRDVDAS